MPLSSAEGALSGQRSPRTKEKKMANQTESMKAAVIREFGDFDVLKLEEVDRPNPDPGACWSRSWPILPRPGRRAFWYWVMSRCLRVAPSG